MVRFFRAKKTRNNYKAIVFRVKKRYSNKMKETSIPKKKSILMYGLNSSGKTKELKKLWRERKNIYRLKKFIYLGASDSLSEIIYHHVNAQDIEKYIKSLHEDDQKEALLHANKQFFKIKVLTELSKNCALFVDDLDKFQGKKLEILKELVKNSNVTIASAQQRKTINKTLLNILEHKQFTAVELGTKSSYDVTNYILIASLIPFAITGNYTVVMMLLLANRYLDKGVGK